MSSRDLDKYFLNMLVLVGARSTCHRRKVGAIIVDSIGIQIGTGYNGVPRKMPHCFEQSNPNFRWGDKLCDGAKDEAGNTNRCLAVHAEQNAMLQCIDINRAYCIYVTATPCFTCAKMILNTPISRVLCLERYADFRGVDLLVARGLSVQYADQLV